MTLMLLSVAENGGWKQRTVRVYTYTYSHPDKIPWELVTEDVRKQFGLHGKTWVLQEHPIFPFKR